MPILSREQEANRHSKDVQELITEPPSWLLRWGTTLFFAILLAIICMAALINYADMIKAKFVLKVSHQGMLTEKQSLIAEINLPLPDSSKVEIGQKVLYGLHSEKSQSYDLLKGHILRVVHSPTKPERVLAISSIEPVKNKRIEASLKTGTVGDAKIIINERSILDRIISSLGNAIKRK